MEIREATLTDLRGLLEIYNYAVSNTTATFDLDVQTLEQRREWFSRYGGKLPLIVEEADGRVRGYACLNRFRDKPAYDRAVELSLYVHPDHFGQGVGTRLLGAIVDRAREHGYHTVMGCITTGNDVSVRLHESFGFERVGEFKQVGWKFGAWQDIMFYELLLD